MIRSRSVGGQFVLALTILASPQVFADSCNTDVEFIHAYPANENASKFKFKFRAESEDCDRYGCSGYINYRIHFDYPSGDSSGKNAIVSYRIPKGQTSREVTDETYPGTATSKIKVRDVEIGEVTCNTP